MDDTFDLLTLMLLPGLSPRHVVEMSRRGPLAQALAHPDEHADIIAEAPRRQIKDGTARRRAEEERRRAAACGAAIVGRDEKTYPELVRATYDPPPVLYARGELMAGEGRTSVAVVGARAATPAGLLAAEGIARDLAAAGLTIVSGLARGIDTAAHRGALSAGGRTVAVLGSALDRLYPLENGDLAAAIAGRGGLVVSEFPLGTSARPGQFPRRNRVIAGWGRGVVVVEAGDKSGALVTARCALDEGREVMAVPGHPSQAGAAGTNGLIRDGAALVRDAADVAAELGLALVVPKAEAASPDPVLRALQPRSPLAVEEIQRRSGLPLGEVLGRLAELEVAHRVRRLPGALFVRA